MAASGERSRATADGSAPATQGEPFGAGSDFFDSHYLRVLAPFHDEAETREEAGAIRELAAIGQHDRVLDVGCGWGRHLVHLRRAGHSVVGIDRSLDLLQATPSPSNADPASMDYRSRPPPVACADMRCLPFPSATFDVVLNLATPLGLFLDDHGAVAVLVEMRRVLRPGGRLLLEGMHRDEVMARYSARTRWWLEDGTEVRARRRFDPITGISEEVLRWRGERGSGEKRHFLRLRSATELAALLDRSALMIRSSWGDWDGQPVRRLSPRLILLAQRSP